MTDDAGFLPLTRSERLLYIQYGCICTAGLDAQLWFVDYIRL